MALLTNFTTVAGVNAQDETALVNGKCTLTPALGFGTAYAVGEDVWGGFSSKFVELTFNAAAEAAGEQVECFGPDANGKLVSLGTLDAGWIVTYGNAGSDKGATSRTQF